MLAVEFDGSFISLRSISFFILNVISWSSVCAMIRMFNVNSFLNMTLFNLIRRVWENFLYTWPNSVVAVRVCSLRDWDLRTFWYYLAHTIRDYTYFYFRLKLVNGVFFSENFRVNFQTTIVVARTLACFFFCLRFWSSLNDLDCRVFVLYFWLILFAIIVFF